MKRLIPILLALMACSDPDDVENGTVVGNPGETAFRMAEGDGFETVGARVGVESMVWEACDGTLQEENVEQVIELTDEDQAFATPNGVWCAAALVPYESVELDIASSPSRAGSSGMAGRVSIDGRLLGHSQHRSMLAGRTSAGR